MASVQDDKDSTVLAKPGRPSSSITNEEISGHRNIQGISPVVQ
jgi:hypothetical protein